MAEIDRFQDEMASLNFTEKLNFVLALLEQGEISENEAYQLILAEGEPKPQEKEEQPAKHITFEFFDSPFY